MAREALDDHINSIRTDWHALKEKWFHGEMLDPVFEGVVRDFCQFDETMQTIYQKVGAFMKGVEQLATGMTVMAESVTAGIGHSNDSLIASDSCKLKEATNQVARGDAPHSALAKLRRDMQFNIIGPMQSHLSNNRNLKVSLDMRRRRLIELTSAKKQYDDCVKRGLSHSDKRFLQAQSGFESAKMTFNDVDRHVFEWLYILEEYRGDILDSTLQTLKYLQYEFFATSAHALSAVLPARMEFRPMVEMTPEHLEAQVEMELQESEEQGGGDAITDFAVRLIDKKSREEGDSGPQLPVDPLSLSSLLSQGFEEGPARRALRLHQNNTQAALDWLINGGGEETEKKKQLADGVRMPTTVKRVKKLKAMRRAQQEKNLRDRGESADSNGGSHRSRNREDRDNASDGESDDEKKERPADRGKAHAPAKPPAKAPAPVDMLFGDEPPAATPEPNAAPADLLGLDPGPATTTDFSQPVHPAPLPLQLSFDVTQCEKPPLPAAVAAGIAQPRGGGATFDLQSAPATTAASGLHLGMAGAAGSTPDLTAAVHMLASQSQVTPEQLLMAAQQLVAQGGQIPGQTLQAHQSGQAATQVAQGSSGHAVQSNGTMGVTRGSAFESLDPLAAP